MNEPDLSKASAAGFAEVLVHDGRNVLGNKGMQVNRVFDRKDNRHIGIRA